MKRTKHHLLNLLTVVLALGAFFPIAWAAITGMKSESDALAIPPKFLFAPEWVAYANVLSSGKYLRSLTNSVLIVGVSTVVSLLLALPAAYRLAFYSDRRSNQTLLFALSTRFMPGVGLIVPLFILYARASLLDTHVGLIVLYVALGVPLALWLMRSFFADIPFEIVEAAMLDGANHGNIVTRIVIPLSGAGLFTTAILISIFAWNEFFFAVNLTSFDAATLPVYMASFFTTEGPTWAKMSAAATMSLLPILLLGWSVQRNLVRGLTFGALK